MKATLRIDGPDLALGILALVASAGYFYETAQIPESLLDDAVGARGVPLAFGWTTAVVGVLLCLRGLLRRRNTDEAPSADSDSGTVLRAHVQALGLLGILAAYIVVLPFAGYIPSTALLIAAVAWFAGGERNRNLIVVAIAGAVALWLVFDPMLDVSLPAGSWWQRP